MDRTDRFNSLNKLSIEKRLLKVFRKTTILLSMTGVIACVAMGIVSYQYSYALKHYGFAQGDIGKAMIVIAEMRSETRAAIGYDDDTLIATAKNAHDLTAEQLDTYISALEDDMITDEGRATYQQIKDGVASYQQIEAQILELGTASDSAKRMQAQQMAGEQMDPVFQQVYADMTSLLDSSVTNGNAMEAKLNVFRVVIFIVILLIIGVGFAGSEKAGKRIARGIAGPLKALADRLDGFAAGDLTSDFPEVKTEDEVGVLGNSMNMLSETLEQALAELKEANTELKKDLEKKEQIDAMRKEFLSNVSHELKTPIALIQGYAEGLMDNINDDEESKEFYCEVIVDEARKMNQMVKKIMDLNQLEFGYNTVTMEHFDIIAMIRAVIAKSDILLKQKEINLAFDEDAPIYVWSDAYMSEEVFTNYLTNAINHADGEKRIDIQLEKKEKTVKITVHNTGEQIPEEDLSKLWDKFYKVDKARTREYGGSGVGLSIVKASMEQLGQPYGVYNCEDGVSFWFELDCQDAAEMIQEQA